MPIYEYNCQECSFHFEVLRLMKDADAEIQCKRCLSTHTRRALSTCFSRGDSSSPKSSSTGCSGCSGGSCSSCGH